MFGLGSWSILCRIYMKAEIKKFEDGLWLVIDGNDKTAWAITEEEILPIRDAIDEWMLK